MSPARHDVGSRLLVAGALAAIAILSSWAVWAALTTRGDVPQSVDRSPAPVPVATGTPPPSPSVPASQAGSGAPGGSSTETAQPPAQLPDLIAFRRDGRLFVARGDGTSARDVAAAPRGPYALSPDGRVLAYVADGRLWLVPVAGGRAVSAGPALGDEVGIGECPVWSVDSRFVYFTRTTPNGGSEVWRVSASGGEPVRLSAGGCPSVSPDGRVVAMLDGSDVVVAAAGRASHRIPLAAQSPIALAAGNADVYVAAFDASARSAVLRVSLSDGQVSSFVGPPTDAPRATWGSLRISPDGRKLAAVAVGDDRYSRVSIIDLASGSAVPLSARRDCYARYWSAAGGHLYYVEGNAYQGEATRLMRVETSGVGRTTVVEGAE